MQDQKMWDWKLQDPENEGPHTNGWPCHNEQGAIVTRDLCTALAALHFVTPSVKCLHVAVMIDHSVVFEESWKVIQVHPRKLLAIFE